MEYFSWEFFIVAVFKKLGWIVYSYSLVILCISYNSFVILASNYADESASGRWYLTAVFVLFPHYLNMIEFVRKNQSFLFIGGLVGDNAVVTKCFRWDRLHITKLIEW